MGLTWCMLPEAGLLWFPMPGIGLINYPLPRQVTIQCGQGTVRLVACATSLVA